MKGIQDLIRPCATLARYEAALAAGTITQDVMVFIADVRQIRWKGEIYDCSQGIKAINETAGLFALADGLVGKNDEYYYLPHKAPADDKEHTFAMLSDLEGAGGGGGESGGGLDPESEQVIAGAFVNLNNRLIEDRNSFATKEELANDVAHLTSEIEQREEVTAAALAELNARVVNNMKVVEQGYLTLKDFAEYVANLTAEIQDNERVIATALTNINERLLALTNG